MLSKSEIHQILTSSKPHLNQLGVSKIGFFGSAGRDEMRENSDIDILIDFENDKETYLNFIATCEFLESIFEAEKVDVVSVKGLSPFIGPHILSEVEYV
ncbi:nucleotidyltransferase family protein [Dyadobacter sp. CY326]|uniref:nucleotidyltransferase family protein n=1 Tax=Dyadobacter sp. CY326 TaxID=2907300 RepID=UPI001F3F3AE6|nr:nucleotidyltransferase domain-containing protein [Dyadobacter sp. CY326]MCE7065844.1 nucleotidyltransferase domain-containing protein [Dyadobacter sp. CY326]